MVLVDEWNFMEEAVNEHGDKIAGHQGNDEPLDHLLEGGESVEDKPGTSVVEAQSQVSGIHKYVIK
jgi:hypothetical protein